MPAPRRPSGASACRDAERQHCADEPGDQDFHLEPGQQVKTITYCHDTYRVTTADGKTHAFWERNLRFKTDSGKDGPEKGAPAITSAGMMGDRASVIFAAPDEFNKMIEPRC